jgi:hypothetical protein
MVNLDCVSQIATATVTAENRVHVAHQQLPYNLRKDKNLRFADKDEAFNVGQRYARIILVWMSKLQVGWMLLKGVFVSCWRTVSCHV